MTSDFTPRRSISRRHLLIGGLAATTAFAAGLAGGGAGLHAEAQQNFSAWNTVQHMAPTITYVAQGRNVAPTLSPIAEGALQDALSRYEIVASRGGWPTLPNGQRLSKGGHGELVGMLRERLAIEGYPVYSSGDPLVFDAGLADAVTRFQKNHGLMATGVVDSETIRAMNVPVEERIFTIRANLPRMKEYTKNLADRFVMINIPATQLETVENGTVYSVHNIVVGMTDRPSPVVLSRVSDVTFNPYWIAPASIVKKDIIPKAQVDPSFLIQQRIRIHDGLGGPEIDPMSIDWHTLSPERYIFRQDPGDDNAMATVKIHFPNNHAVYMHDTPTKNLFSAEQRYFSSGCVRVDQVHILTEWLLRSTPDWNRSRIEQVIASGENTKVNIKENLQVRMVYLTAWASPDGTVNFRPDVYRLDGTGFVVGQPEPLSGQIVAVGAPPAGMEQHVTGQPAPGLQPASAVGVPGAPVSGARDVWQRANRRTN